jgi:hypothetical protein
MPLSIPARRFKETIASLRRFAVPSYLLPNLGGYTFAVTEASVLALATDRYSGMSITLEDGRSETADLGFYWVSRETAALVVKRLGRSDTAHVTLTAEGASTVIAVVGREDDLRIGESNPRGLGALFTGLTGAFDRALEQEPAPFPVARWHNFERFARVAAADLPMKLVQSAGTTSPAAWLYADSDMDREGDRPRHRVRALASATLLV